MSMNTQRVRHRLWRLFGQTLPRAGAISCILLAPVLEAAVREWKLDPDFRTDVAAGSIITTMARSPEGLVYVGGELVLRGREGVANLVRLQADGSVDPDFRGPLNGGIQGLGVDTDGRLLVASYQQPTLVRLSPTGLRDAGFKAGSIGDGFGFFPELIPLNDPQHLILQPDGRWFVAGSDSLRFMGQTGFVRLSTKGSIDEGFLHGNGIAAPVVTRILAAVGIGDGRVVIGGEFARVHDQPVANFARILADGRLDTTFNPGATIWSAQDGTPRTGLVRALALAPNGDLLAGVEIDKQGKIEGFKVVRIKPDGTLDPTFSTAGTIDGEITAIGLLSDGRVVVGGVFRTFSGMACDSIVCLSKDGAVESVFPIAPGAPRRIQSVAALNIAPDDRVYVAAGRPGSGLFRLLLEAPAPEPPKITEHPSNQKVTEGRELVLQIVLEGGSDAQVQWLRDGTEISGASAPKLIIPRVTLGHSGTYHAVVNSPSGTAESRSARVEIVPAQRRSGGVDLTFQPATSPVYPVLDLVDLGSEGVLVARKTADSTRAEIVAYTLLGALDPRIQVTLTGTKPITRLRSVADGNQGFFIGGSFSAMNGGAVPPLIRTDRIGNRTPTFNPSFNAGAEVSDIAQAADGKWWVAGKFTHVGGSARPGVVRLLPNGEVDPGFVPQSNPNDPPFSPNGFNAVRPLADGRVLVSGFASTRILDAEGKHVAGLNLAVGAEFARAVLVHDDGLILLGTEAATIRVGNEVASGLIPILTTGALDSRYRHSLESPSVRTIHSLPGGRIVVGGVFSRTGGPQEPGLLRFSFDGKPDPSLNIGQGVSGASAREINVIQPASNGALWVGGMFDRFDGVAVPGLVRLQSPTPVRPLKPNRNQGRFSVAVEASPGQSYRMEFIDQLGSGTWRSFQPVLSQGTELKLEDPEASGPHRFYRVVED